MRPARVVAEVLLQREEPAGRPGVPVTAFLFWFIPNFVCLLSASDADDGLPSGRDADLRREVHELRARLEAPRAPR